MKIGSNSALFICLQQAAKKWLKEGATGEACRYRRAPKDGILVFPRMQPTDAVL
jgi:hypothetical protein